jgi:hypothetical protein
MTQRGWFRRQRDAEPFSRAVSGVTVCRPDCPDERHRHENRPNRQYLGLIDVQPTFMPGGGLAVPDGDRIVPVINRLMARFEHAFATQDWHKPNHHSFASAHPGRVPYETIELPYGTQILWPDHGIAGTREAMIHPDIDQTRIELIVRKGCRIELDSYSAFFENDHVTPTGLDGWLGNAASASWSCAASPPISVSRGRPRTRPASATT